MPEPPVLTEPKEPDSHLPAPRPGQRYTVRFDTFLADEFDRRDFAELFYFISHFYVVIPDPKVITSSKTELLKTILKDFDIRGGVSRWRPWPVLSGFIVPIQRENWPFVPSVTAESVLEIYDQEFALKAKNSLNLKNFQGAYIVGSSRPIYYSETGELVAKTTSDEVPLRDIDVNEFFILDLSNAPQGQVSCTLRVLRTIILDETINFLNAFAFELDQAFHVYGYRRRDGDFLLQSVNDWWLRRFLHALGRVVEFGDASAGSSAYWARVDFC